MDGYRVDGTVLGETRLHGPNVFRVGSVHTANEVDERLSGEIEYCATPRALAPMGFLWTGPQVLYS